MPGCSLFKGHGGQPFGAAAPGTPVGFSYADDCRSHSNPSIPFCRSIA